MTDSKDVYHSIRDAYNRSPNGADLLYLSRSCYGGVVRFRKRDGAISTPMGVHTPISEEAFAARVSTWHPRVKNTKFVHSDFEPLLDSAKSGDLIYCDPPYSDSQAILYGAQAFALPRLLSAIDRAKSRGVRVVLSIDGTKRSGDHTVSLPIPSGLFAREVFLNVGRSMLRRFQLKGSSLESEAVRDRLLLTW